MRIKCNFDGRKNNSNLKLKNDKCWYECKKHHVCDKDYIWNPLTCSCENGKYLPSVIDDSVITYDEIINAETKLNNGETKAIPTNFNEKT